MIRRFHGTYAFAKRSTGMLYTDYNIPYEILNIAQAFIMLVDCIICEKQKNGYLNNSSSFGRKLRDSFWFLAVRTDHEDQIIWIYKNPKLKNAIIVNDAYHLIKIWMRRIIHDGRFCKTLEIMRNRPSWIILRIQILISDMRH